MKAKNVSNSAKVLSVIIALSIYFGKMVITKELPTPSEVDGIIKISAYAMLPFLTIDVAVLSTSVVKYIKGKKDIGE